MEGAPFFPESSPEDDDDASFEKKDKKDSREKRLPLFEKPETGDKKKKSFEIFADDKPEKKDDKEPPVDKLAEDEKQMIVSEVIKDRQADVRQELVAAEDDSADEQEALVGATFLEALEHEVDNGTPVEEALDIAEDQAAEVADIELEPGDDEQEILDEETEEDNTTAPTPVASTTGASSTPPPPVPPVPPSGSTPPSGGGFTPVVPIGPPIPVPVVRALRAPEVIVVPDKRRERANLLVGGLIGYFVGRRRGRIKTEKKLFPVQEKLENQVKDLTGQLLEREQKLRTAARSRYEQNPGSSKKTIERMQQLQQLKRAEKLRAVKKPEQIGKFVMGAERPAVKPETPKSVERMTVPELLEVAAVIKIEQGSVKRLYEARHLNDEGLRRVVRAFLRGERYDHMIRENIQSPEIYRQQTEQHNTPSAQNSTAEALRHVLQDPGTGSNFALPSLNQSVSQPVRPGKGFQPRSAKSRAPIIAAGVLAILTLTMLLLLI